MSDLPERIWAFPPTTFDECDVWQKEQHENAVEYIRADLRPTPSLAEAAATVLLAMERAQIDLQILRMFFNGQPRSALEALAALDQIKGA
jgi:hypothetical protein